MAVNIPGGSEDRIPGTVRFSEDVIADIARKEIVGTEGVAGVEEGFVRGALARVRGDARAGIHIDIGEGEIALGVTMTVVYGASIPDVANAVRARVSKAIEDMTGYRVRAINVYVDKLAVPSPKK